jgi:Zn-dependent protease/CBS domain-containing protein
MSEMAGRGATPGGAGTPVTDRPAAQMSGSFPLARLFGVAVYIHWSWFLIFVLVSWSLASGYLPDVYPEWERATYWLVGGVTAVLFFGSVLTHELAHSLLARRRGLPVANITLFIFGGVSSLSAEPRSAKEEFWIAFVGPLTSFALAALFFVVWLAARAADVTSAKAAAGYLAEINVALGVFNLLPGFPLDGGRVLRAAVWGARGNMLEATKIAANAGRAVAAILIGLGVLSLLGLGGFGGAWFILIGFFLWNAAENAYQQLLIQRSLQGITVANLVETAVPLVRPDTSLRSLAHEGILREYRRAFFVAGEGGEVLGIVTLTDLSRAHGDEWDSKTVREIMTPRDKLIAVTPQTPALAALELMAEHDLNQLVVLADGRVAGLVTRATLMRAMQYRMKLQDAR